MFIIINRDEGEFDFLLFSNNCLCVGGKYGEVGRFGVKIRLLGVK